MVRVKKFIKFIRLKISYESVDFTELHLNAPSLNIHGLFWRRWACPGEVRGDGWAWLSR